MDRDVAEMSFIFVGGGPASLAGAIHLARLVEAHNQRIERGEIKGEPIEKESIVVLEKGPEFGSHELSGAVMDPCGLQELFPDFLAQGCPIASTVTGDEVFYLGKRWQIRLPIVPAPLRNHGNLLVSINKLVGWLAQKAEEAGVTLAAGMPIAELLVENDRVIGVRGTDMGRDKNGKPKANFQAGTDFHAPVTILGEGTRGHLTKWLTNRFELAAGKHPMVWSVGVKEIWQVPPEQHSLGKVVHTMGFPLKNEEYGGSFIYHLADHQIALGLVSGLEYRDPLFDPQRALQTLKTHPYVRELLSGGSLVRYGAKTIPMGGYHAIGQLSTDGCLIIGDSAGLMNGLRLKGIHLAIKSGMLAAEVALQAFLQGDTSRQQLKAYDDKLLTSWIGRELHGVRDGHAGFERGFLAGLINAGFVTLTGGKGMLTSGLGRRPGHTRMRKLRDYHGSECPPSEFKPDGLLTFRKIDEVMKSGTTHEENQPCHLVISEQDRQTICNTRCQEEFGNPCQHFCPANVYEMIASGERGRAELQINAANCVHCKTCDIMDPYQVINWVAPEAGGGPIYSGM